jgi:hypothetical protein
VSAPDRDRQRRFLRDAARPGAAIERRHSWLTVVYPETDMEGEWLVTGASLRGRDLDDLIPRYLIGRELTEQGHVTGERLGRLYSTVEGLAHLWRVAWGEPDVQQILDVTEAAIWKLIHKELL